MRATVSELLDYDGKCRREEMLRDIFLPFETETILKLPISDRPSSDSLYWPFENKEHYTVRSGHHYHRKLHHNILGNPSSSGERNIQWQLIWHCPAEPKVKHFLWRALTFLCKPST